VRTILNSYISLCKQNCHSLKIYWHTSSYSSVSSVAVNHNYFLSVFKLKSWNAHRIVQRCYITKTISRILCNHECMITLWAFSSVNLLFTFNHIYFRWSSNNLVIFFHVSFILLLSHCLFVSDHDVLSDSVWSLIIHVLIYDKVIATTDSCSDVK